ncbi:unnamed protein product [Allacma fusca]|uniref:Uncharacterized protein n=1 Tax=Allacma fusca TaxID=39272 RepID=A0A8J2JUI3_9HEXA|nr:unnamed protein product [Allacma fusca]
MRQTCPAYNLQSQVHISSNKSLDLTCRLIVGEYYCIVGIKYQDQLKLHISNDHSGAHRIGQNFPIRNVSLQESRYLELSRSFSSCSVFSG